MGGASATAWWHCLLFITCLARLLHVDGALEAAADPTVPPCRRVPAKTGRSPESRMDPSRIGTLRC